MGLMLSQSRARIGEHITWNLNPRYFVFDTIEYNALVDHEVVCKYPKSMKTGQYHVRFFVHLKLETSKTHAVVVVPTR